MSTPSARDQLSDRNMTDWAAFREADIAANIELAAFAAREEAILKTLDVFAVIMYIRGRERHFEALAKLTGPASIASERAMLTYRERTTHFFDVVEADRKLSDILGNR